MAEQSKRTGMWSLLLMVATLIILNADQMVMSPSINAIEKDFGVTDREIGFITSAFTVIGALISLVWGYFGDKYNRKKLLFFSVLVGEIPCLLSAFSMNFTMLFIFRALTGIGVGASFPLVFSMAGDMFEEKSRPKAMAIISTSIAIGQIVGMAVAGFTNTVTPLTWRLPFLLVSIPNFIIIIIFSLLVEEPKRGSKEFAIGELVESGIEYKKKISAGDYLNLVKIKTNFLLFIQGILGTIPWGAIPYFLVTFFEREKNIPPSMGTIIFLIFGVGNLFGILAGGYIGNVLYNIRKGWVSLFCGVTTALGAFLAMATLNFNYSDEKFYLLSILGFFTAFTLSLTGPNVKTLLINVNKPEDRARIFSVFNLTDSLGTGIGQLFAGSISAGLALKGISNSLGKALNYSALFWFGCAVLLCVLALFVSKDVQKLKNYFSNLKIQMLKK